MDEPANPKISPMTGPGGETAAEPLVIPVIQEEISISKVVEDTGARLRVRIATEEERQQVPLTDILEEVSVERVPMNRFVAERTAPRTEGNVVIVPVFETVAVVETRLLLKEEIHIVRQRREETRQEEIVLRKEVPIVERKASSQEDWKQEGPEKPDVPEQNR